MQPRLKIGVLYSRVRVEEKWIFAAMEKQGIDYVRLDNRKIHFDLDDPTPWHTFEVVLERSISYNSGLYTLRMLNAWGVPTVNTAAVAEVCGDKLTTSAILAQANVPQPRNGQVTAARATPRRSVSRGVVCWLVEENKRRSDELIARRRCLCRS